MDEEQIRLRSGRIAGVGTNKNEVLKSDAAVTKEPSMRSAHSSVAGTVRSTASQKRLLEARAAREKAELEKERLAIETKLEQQRLDSERKLEQQRLDSERKLEKKRLETERDLIETRLSEQIALLDQDDKSSRASAESRVRGWVDEHRDQGAHHDHGLGQVKLQDQPDKNIASLAIAITEAVKRVSPPPAPTGDKLIGRLSARDLPSFSGDPLEWFRFKSTFETTTVIGQYSDEENVARLQRCLAGEAWEAVAARLVTTRSSAADIMKTLEMRFGRPDLVLHKLIGNMKRLPKLTGARSDLLVLATKVSNCVAAIEATERLEYLHSPDLVTEVVGKLTESLVYRWLDYWAASDKGEPRLSALALYLMSEAEKVCNAGAVELPQKPTARFFPSTSKRPVLTITEEDDESSVNAVAETKKIGLKCIYCGKTEHSIDNCSDYRILDVNKRWDWACEKKLCFACLKSRHRRDRCRSKKKCATCKRGHHSLLHRDDWQKGEDRNEGKPECSYTTANVWDQSSKKVYLKVLPVTIEGPAGSMSTFALLDEGSTVSLVERHIAETIGVDGPMADLNLHGAVGDCLRIPSYRVSLTLRTSDGTHKLDNVRTVDNLTLPTQILDCTDLASLPHLRDIPLQTFKGKPTMIIGQDYWYLIVSRQVREGRKNEPVASLTRLGWVLHGFAAGKPNSIDYGCHLHNHGDDDTLHDLVKSYFKFDSIGIKRDDSQRNSSEERRALDILDRKSKKVGNRWEAGLLWRSDDVKLPDNRRSAECRLKTIEKSMDNDTSFASDYEKQVVNMLDKGYAQEVTGPLTGKRLWFLPHFGVRNPNKPGKLRLVFDAKAQTNGISLNTELLSGPDLLNSLLGILFRFRERAVAVTGDIREMFLQVKIIAEDQEAQCFLWRGMDRRDPPRIFKMTSMTFGATSSPCTATYILRRNAEQFIDTHPRAVEAIRRRHYVDDYLDSVDTEEEMKQLISDVEMVHSAGGFEIRGWASNSKSVLPKNSESNPVNLLQQAESEERTLGLIWKSTTDVLGFDVTLKKVDKDVAQGLRRPTKREMLKIIMSVFDPLGFLCPILIRGKIMLQDVWRSGIQWDQRIGEKTAEKWYRWLRDLKKCQTFTIPRCYGFRTLLGLQLHVFADASEQAYACVAFLRQDSKVIFAAAKSRVAPLKPSTVPRLELQAALMGARLGTTIEKEHDIVIRQRFFWTDSQTVWWWIRNNPRKKMPFVSNRLSEIDDLTKSEEWRWHPGQFNVADGATRADGNLEAAQSKWVQGPDFLRLSEDNWPSEVPKAYEEEEPLQVQQVFLIVEAQKLIEYSRFSNWRRLLRCVARVILFVKKCRKQRIHLTPDHEKQAESLILRQVQRDSFNDDIAALQSIGRLQHASRLHRLNPKLDEFNVLRVQSRLESARDLPIELKRPIILDARHYVTKLIIEHKHRQLGHNNSDTLINELRQQYHILHLRTTVRSMISRCVTCKARRARCEQPMMAGLPPARLHHHCRPFTYCGVDLFGPMLVTIGRRHEKRWGVLFTCFNTRAVTIELAATLSTDSTILAIRRMAARRGYPKQIYSDCGTNFRGADRELRTAAQEVFQNQRLTEETSALGIEWRFNPPDAAHMGGAWERLVRSLKAALYATLHSRAPKEEVLATLIAEAENIVNSRPLTHISLDPNEEEALTPNHFLLGASNPLPRPGDFSDQDFCLRKQWRIAQRLTDHFWSRWIREYLPNLHERRRWNRDNGQGNVRIGDLVLIADPNAPRNVWPRGRVTATTPGRDGRVRIVEVATRGGTLRRPVTRVVTLLRAAADEPAAPAPAASCCHH